MSEINRPMSPEMFRQFIEENYRKFQPIERWRFSSLMHKLLTENEYKNVLLYLFGTSTSKMVDARKLAVVVALSSEDPHEPPNDVFLQEIQAIYRQSLIEQGQMVLKI